MALTGSGPSTCLIEFIRNTHRHLQSLHPIRKHYLVDEVEKERSRREKENKEMNVSLGRPSIPVVLLSG